MFPLAWDAAGDITEHFGYDSTHEVPPPSPLPMSHAHSIPCGMLLIYQVKQTVVFLLMALTYSSIIELPWGVYMTFVLEERHGFNKQVSGAQGVLYDITHMLNSYHR